MLDCEQVANADCEYPLDPNQISPRWGYEYPFDGQTDFLSCYTVKRKKEYFTEINIVTI